MSEVSLNRGIVRRGLGAARATHRPCLLAVALAASAAASPALVAQGRTPTPLAAALQDADGDHRPDRLGAAVQVEGVVTWAPRAVRESLAVFFIQDETRGVRVVWQRSAALGAGVELGHHVVVRGGIDEHYGADEIRAESVLVVGSGPAPAPRTVLAAQVGGRRYAGELVRVAGRISRGSTVDTMYLEDASGRVALDFASTFYRSPEFTQRLRRAVRAEIVGLADQRAQRGAPDRGYRLRPRHLSDVRFESGPPYFALGASAAVLLVGLLMLSLWSQRRRAERRARQFEDHADALRQSEAKYRSLVDGCPFGVYRSSLDGRFLAVNRALIAMLGYGSAEELLRDGVIALYRHPEHRETLIRDRDASGRIDREVEWKRRDGSSLLVHLTGRVLTDALGRPEGFEVFVNDVTKRRVLEQQLRQAQKMEAIGQFSGGLAHDFNNVLAAILANVEFLATSLPDASAEHRRCLEETAAAAYLGSRVVRRLMAFARAGELRPQPTDLNALLGNFAALARRLLPSNIELRCVGEGVRRVIASADTTAVEQILLNLATNARDAMPGGGILLLAAENTPAGDGMGHSSRSARSGGYACVVVSDTGVGMDDATRRRIFEPFFTTKDTGRGTGLGLAMVATLMHQQGGYVECHSAPGAGTTFRLYFAAAESADGATAQEDPNEAPRGHEHILVVDDEAPVRSAAARTLRSLGYRVLEAKDAEEALGAFRRAGDIDLVLTDVGLPDRSGPELYRAPTAVGTRMPVVFMSGSAPHEGPGGAPRTGLAILQKPWTRVELALSVRQALDQPHRPLLS